jgi:hypothetical protein
MEFSIVRDRIYNVVYADNVILGPHPVLVVVLLQPADEDDMNTWYDEEHLGMIAKTPSYKRTRRYKLHETSDQTLPKYLSIHEFGEMAALTSPELQAASTTEWSKKVLGAAKVVEPHVYSLVKGLGDW